MSRIIRNTIRVNPAQAFSLEGDKNLFDKIVADQEKNAGPLRPADNWDLDIGGHEGGKYFASRQSGKPIEFDAYSDNEYYKKFSSLSKMMEPFVGSTGKQGINRDVIQEYYAYIKGIDHLNILPNYFEPNGEMKSQASDLLITDLGSMIDMNLISSFLDPSAAQYKILEVGGGYGRLAEVFFNMYGGHNIKYVLLDVVPASLMYSYLYLSKNFQDLRIGFYYNDDPFDMDLFDCYIMPAWHFDISTGAETFDCCINIQSMQEMNQYHVDYYLDMFDRLLKNGSGIAYISNEKDYIFRGEWNYPKNWRLLLKTRTPRSWTRNSPTEIFSKGTTSFERENHLVDFIYSLQLDEFDRNLDQLKKISGLQLDLQKSQQGLQKNQQAMSSLQLELQKSQQEITNLQLELQKSQQEISTLRLILLRMPLAQDEPTIEKAEESIRALDEYYRSRELPAVTMLFKNLSKIDAHLITASLYLRSGRYRKALSHLIIVGLMDPPIFFSIQTLKIIVDGLIPWLRRAKRG